MYPLVEQHGMPRKICIVRKDLNMRKGKIAAQTGHGFEGDALEMWKSGRKPEDLEVGSAEYVYYMEKFTKIVVSVNSEAELDEAYEKAKAAGLKCRLVIDSGLTEFNNVPTKTCLCIGPCFKYEHEPITVNMQLM